MEPGIWIPEYLNTGHKKVRFSDESGIQASGIRMVTVIDEAANFGRIAIPGRSIRWSLVFRSPMYYVNQTVLIKVLGNWIPTVIQNNCFTKSGEYLMMSSQILLMYDSSISKIFEKSSSFMISMLVWLSPFLYSRLQSNNRIFGFSIRRFILGWVTSCKIF